MGDDFVFLFFGKIIPVKANLGYTEKYHGLLLSFSPDDSTAKVQVLNDFPFIETNRINLWSCTTHKEGFYFFHTDRKVKNDPLGLQVSILSTAGKWETQTLTCAGTHSTEGVHPKSRFLHKNMKDYVIIPSISDEDPSHGFKNIKWTFLENKLVMVAPHIQVTKTDKLHRSAVISFNLEERQYTVSLLPQSGIPCIRGKNLFMFGFERENDYYGKALDMYLSVYNLQKLIHNPEALEPIQALGRPFEAENSEIQAGKLSTDFSCTHYKRNRSRRAYEVKDRTSFANLDEVKMFFRAGNLAREYFLTVSEEGVYSRILMGTMQFKEVNTNTSVPLVGVGPVSIGITINRNFDKYGKWIRLVELQYNNETSEFVTTDKLDESNWEKLQASLMQRTELTERLAYIDKGFQWNGQTYILYYQPSGINEQIGVSSLNVAPGLTKRSGWYIKAL